VGDHAGGGGLAVGSGDGDDRDASRATVRKEHVHDRSSHAARVPLGGVRVHAEAGSGVDLDNSATGLAHRAGDIGGDQIHPGDV
jgi:hypothetical protein